MLDTARECIYAPMKSNNHVRLLTDNVSEHVTGDTMLMCYMVNLLQSFCTLEQIPLFIGPFKIQRD